MADETSLLHRAQHVAADFVSRLDSWRNYLTGLGTERDKGIHTHMDLELLSHEALHRLHRGSPLHARAVDLLPEEAFREGFEVHVPKDAGLAAAVNAALSDLGAEEKLWEADKLGRLYGGALVAIGVNGRRDRPAEKLNLEGLQSVEFLNVFSAREAWAVDYYLDMAARDYGEVASYQLTPLLGGYTEGWSTVHSSRTLRFEGVRLDRDERQALQGWGDSVLQRVHAGIRDWASGYAGVSTLLHDAAQGVYKLPELTQLLMQNKVDVLQHRMAMQDMYKSSMRALVLGKDESYERLVTQFSGIEGILMRLDFRLAAELGYPVTVLLGQAPAGLNATGSADLETFRAAARARQRKVVKPQLEKLVRILFRAKRGPSKGVEPENWSIHFRPLSQPTDAEVANTRYIHAQTDEVRIRANIITPAMALSRLSGDEYANEVSIDEDGDGLELQPGQVLPLEETLPGEAPALPGALAIVERVAARKLPRGAGLGMLRRFFNLTPEEAELVMGEVGLSFFQAPADAPPASTPPPARVDSAPRQDDAREAVALLLAEVKAGTLPMPVAVRRAAKALGLSRRAARAVLRGMLGQRQRTVLKTTHADEAGTNFPRQGEDKEVSLRTSEVQAFPLEYALELREKWPAIWAKGGNVLGNKQFTRLAPVARRGGAVRTPTEEKAVRLREAWAARHFSNNRLAGVVAQVKWLVVGTLGVEGMKALLEREKARLSKK